MDLAILSAASALAGSLIGGASTLTSSWFTQRGQLRAQVLVQEAVKREALYAEFIIEASKRFAEAWAHQAKDPDVVAGLYSAIERMRLTSSSEVIRVAEEVMRRLVRDYAAPVKTFDEFQEFIGSEDIRDPLREFGEVCRVELRAADRWSNGGFGLPVPAVIVHLSGTAPHGHRIAVFAMHAYGSLSRRAGTTFGGVLAADWLQKQRGLILLSIDNCNRQARLRITKALRAGWGWRRCRGGSACRGF